MITVYWETPELIRLDYANPVNSWDEYDQAVAESYALARSVDHPVFILHNAGRTRMPPGNAFLHLRRAWLTLPANVHLIASVVSHTMAADVVNLSTRFLGVRRWYMAGSLEQAYQQIAHVKHLSNLRLSPHG